MSNPKYAILIYDQDINRRYWLKDNVYPDTITFTSVSKAKIYIKQENTLPVYNGSYEICIYKEGLVQDEN